MSDFQFNPPTASSIASASLGLAFGIGELSNFVSNLKGADGCGGFPSGIRIRDTLTKLGDSAEQMSIRLTKAVQEYKAAVIAAGGLITQQEAENERNIAKAGEGEELAGAPAWIKSLTPSKQAPFAVPTGPSASDQINSTLTPNLPDVPTASPDAAGKFSCAAAPESVWGLTLDVCAANLTDAEAAKLTMLADQWNQLGTDLTSAVTLFHRIVEMKVASGGWTGNSGHEMHKAATKLVTTSVEISAQASANGAAVMAWAGSLGDTKSFMDQLGAARKTNLAAAPPESRARVQNESDLLARTKILGTYNPAVTAIATGLSNLTDPSSPVTGVPLIIGGPRPSSQGGTTPSASGGSTAASSAGGGGGGTGGSGSTAAANKAGEDAAKSLTRQGSGDPAAAANASKNAAAQSGQGNPASAAQSAMSKAGDATKGLGSKGGASPLTRSAGLGSLADAEKSAAAKAAAGLGKGGGAGGGGTGGGGIGKLGGAGIAAAEGSLSARSAAGLSAAERAMAAPQAAPAATRPGMSPGMGGARGAHGGGENEKEHKSARYLISEENGEEIAGELPDTAPPVLGGLNLDTTDNPDTTR